MKKNFLTILTLIICLFSFSRVHGTENDPSKFLNDKLNVDLYQDTNVSKKFVEEFENKFEKSEECEIENIPIKNSEGKVSQTETNIGFVHKEATPGDDTLYIINEKKYLLINGEKEFTSSMKHNESSEKETINSQLIVDDRITFSYPTNFEALLYIRDKNNNFVPYSDGKYIEKPGEYQLKIINKITLEEIVENGKGYTFKTDANNKKIFIEKNYKSTLKFKINSQSEGPSGVSGVVASGLQSAIVWLAEKISYVIAWGLKNIFIPVVTSIIKIAWAVSKVTFFSWFFNILHGIIVLLLNIVDIFEGVSNILIGIDGVRVGSGETAPNLIYAFLTFHDFRAFFYKVTAIGAILAFVFTIYVLMMHTVSSGGNQQKTVGQIIGAGTRSLAAFILLPVILLFFVNLCSLVMGQIVKITRNSETEDMTLASYIYSSIVYFSRESMDENNKDNNLTFKKVNNFNEFLQTYGNISPIYKNPKVIKYCGGVAHFNYLIGFVSVIFAIYILLATALSFIQRLFEVIILYTFSPIFAATIALDGGEIFTNWRDLLIAKSVVGYSVLVVMNLFFLFMPKFLSGNFIFVDDSAVLNLAAKIILMIFGLYAASMADALIIPMINWLAGQGATATMEVIGGPTRNFATSMFQRVTGIDLSRIIRGSGGGGSGIRGPDGQYR